MNTSSITPLPPASPPLSLNALDNVYAGTCRPRHHPKLAFRSLPDPDFSDNGFLPTLG